MSYYLENLIEDLDNVLKTKLNQYIQEVNTRETGTTPLETIDSNAFYFQTLDQNIVNFTQAVFYFVSGAPNVEGEGPSVLLTYNIDVYILFGNSNEPDLSLKSIRYHQALVETITKRWLSFSRKRVKIVNIDPVGFAGLNKTTTVRATGLTLEVTIGF